MKTKHFLKSMISIVLTLVLLVSMVTVSFVSASAATIDVSQTGATRYVYLSTTNLNWSTYKAYFFDVTTVGQAWPGYTMSYYNGNYRVAIPEGAKNVVFNNGSGTQLADTSLTTTTGAYTYNGSKLVDWDVTPADAGLESSSGGSGDVSGGLSGETKTIYVGIISYLINDGKIPQIHYWNNSGLDQKVTLTATSEKVSHSVGSSYWSNASQTFTVYTADIPVEATHFQSYLQSENKYGTPDCTIADNKILIIFEYGGTHHNVMKDYTVTGGDDDPIEPIDFTKVCFRDDFSDGSVDAADADVLVSFDSGKTKSVMKKTVDAMSGHDMWYADIPTGATSVAFYRASVIDHSIWNTWSAKLSASPTGLYRATGWGTGSWGTSTHYFAIPDSDDIKNLSFGIWADIKGNSNVYDAVIARKVSSSEFHLYLPSNTPDSIKLYTSFASLTIGTKSITDGTAFDFSSASSFSIQYKQTEKDTSTKSATLKVYKTTDTATLLLNTKRELYTGTVADLADYTSEYKDAISTSGQIYLYDEKGELVNSADGATKLKKIKGRGNSSFSASMKLYGKYAYNFNLDKKVALVDGAQKSKKWCLLANNVDHTMMRNTFIYALAADVNIKYTPKTRLVDVYNNGYYLGAYVITEKVEYGGSTLMDDMKNLDDGNEEANIEAYGDEDIMDTLESHLIQKTGTHTVNSRTYTYQYTTSDDKTNYPYHQPENYEEYNYLLEFELYDRYKNEASWFVSPRTGQAVVVKYPEFATEDEMKWIISEFEAAESAIYDKNSDFNAIDSVVDVDSFARMYLLQELSINLDSCATSYYIHNDLTSGKLVSSPVWDYDWAFGAYAKDLKYVYNGSSVVESSNMSQPKQVFVKNKALKTDLNDNTKSSNYNFQAKLVHNSTVWERCRYIWTNEFVDALSKYIDNDYLDAGKSNDSVTEGIMLTQWLPSFSSSVKMNDARWSSLTYTGDDWGTKVTSDYNNHSFNFYVGNCSSSGTASKTYENTVYYLNDWVTTRWNYMSNDMKLYDETLVEKYELSDVSFTATVDSSDPSKLTVTPSAVATLNGKAVADSDIVYSVYLNSEQVYNSNFTQKSCTVTLAEGTNEVYVVVSIKDTDLSEQTQAQSFEYIKEPEVTVTFKFKSMLSYRYAPTIVVDGVQYPMTKETVTADDSEETTMCWYTADVIIKQSKDTAVTFTNAVSMNALATVNASEDTTLYFGCNNLNTGDTAVELTSYNVPELEYIMNFSKSADNMLINEISDAALATTTIGGTQYIVGNVNSDEKLDILDVTEIQLALIEKNELSTTENYLADFNLDQVMSIMDATLIQMYIAQ